MDLSTIIGLLLGVGGVLAGFLMEGGNPMSLMEPSAAVIVFGGSFGATMLSFALKHSVSFPVLVKQTFFSKQTDPVELVQTIVALAKKARQAGILALETEAKNLENPFVRSAVQLVVDGTQPELVREILETEIDGMRTRHKHGIDFFAAWGGFCPTLGVLGTVMGLVHMLENLSDPGAMGPSIAVAFIATFYGVGFANLVLLPFAAKLKGKSHEETAAYEVALEGVLSLQAGDNPRVVAMRMRSFLSPKDKVRLGEEF
ncbi:MAG: flagellar motor protein [Armatimonadota bacterium]